MHPDALIDRLREVFDEPGGDKWSLIVELAWAGAHWFRWADFFGERKSQYMTILGERDQYRDGEYRNDQLRRKALSERWQIHRSIRGYLPSEVSYPNFLEADFVSAEIMFDKMLIEPSPASFAEYFTKAREWWQIQTLDQMPHMDDVSDELVEAGLLAVGAIIPPRVRIKALTAGQLRECAKRLGLASAVKAVNLRTIEALPEDHEERIGHALKEIFDPTNYFSYLPPPGLNWAQFQDIRIHLKAQAVALVDISYGQVDRNSLALLCDEIDD